MSRVYLSGTVRPVDQFGQMIIDLDPASRDKIEHLEKTNKGRTPRFHNIVALKFTHSFKLSDGEKKVGQLVKVCAQIRRYSFRGIVGWNLHCLSLGAYGAADMRESNAGLAYEDGGDSDGCSGTGGTDN